MRALCGAIITAGALIVLGLTALGIGTRYQLLGEVGTDGKERWLTFKTLDTPLTLILILMVITLGIGIATAFIGLAYHHYRRHHEHLRHGPPTESGSRVAL